MRLGGPLFEKFDTPESWVAAARRLGYRALVCPLQPGAPADQIRAYEHAARQADLVIAEVGAWSNPLSSNPGTAQAAFEKCCRSLELADRIGARCCVNIAGACGDQWDGPHPANLSKETFEKIVEITQRIIDEVEPTRTHFALEAMPWIWPDSPESYLRILQAIDRRQCAVHFDPVNMINSPRRYFFNSDFLQECFQLLGPHIKTCHAKDIALRGKLTVHLDEVRPGLGGLDYATYLRELSRLDADVPLILEHLPNADEYQLAAEHIRAVAQREGIAL